VPHHENPKGGADALLLVVGQVVPIRLSAEAREALTSLATRDGSTRSQVVERLVLEASTS
jgi:hypothetical protein